VQTFDQWIGGAGLGTNAAAPAGADYANVDLLQGIS
jgi:hypothetical protein